MRPGDLAFDPTRHRTSAEIQGTSTSSPSWIDSALDAGASLVHSAEGLATSTVNTGTNLIQRAGDGLGGARDWAANGIHSAERGISNEAHAIGHEASALGRSAWTGLNENQRMVSRGIHDAEAWVSDGVHEGEDWVDRTSHAHAHGVIGRAFADTATFGGQVVGGVVNGATRLVGGTLDAVEHPLNTALGLEGIAEHAGVPLLRELHHTASAATGQESWHDAWEHMNNPEVINRDDATYWSNFVAGQRGANGQREGGIIDPYRRVLSEHSPSGRPRYGELLGNAIADVGSFFLGGGEADAAAHAAPAVDAAAHAAPAVDAAAHAAPAVNAAAHVAPAVDGAAQAADAAHAAATVDAAAHAAPAVDATAHTAPSLREPISSDMADMVESLRDHGAIPTEGLRVPAAEATHPMRAPGERAAIPPPAPTVAREPVPRIVEPVHHVAWDQRAHEMPNPVREIDPRPGPEPQLRSAGDRYAMNPLDPNPPVATNGSLGRHFDPHEVPTPAQRANGGTNWPPNEGAAGPIRPVHVEPRTPIHRVNNEHGTYVSPEGTPLHERAVAPEYDGEGNLLDYAREEHSYTVGNGGATAQSSEAAKAFDQPGGGPQLQFQPSEAQPHGRPAIQLEREGTFVAERHLYRDMATADEHSEIMRAVREHEAAGGHAPVRGPVSRSAEHRFDPGHRVDTPIAPEPPRVQATASSTRPQQMRETQVVTTSPPNVPRPIVPGERPPTTMPRAPVVPRAIEPAAPVPAPGSAHGVHSSAAHHGHGLHDAMTIGHFNHYLHGAHMAHEADEANRREEDE